MLRMFFMFSAIISLIRNIRTIIGLAILVIVGGFIYILVNNDFDVMLAFTQIIGHIKSVYGWIKGQVSKLAL